MTKVRLTRIIKSYIIDSQGTAYGDEIQVLKYKGLKQEGDIIVIKELIINMELGSKMEFEAIRNMQQKVLEHGINIETLHLIV